MISRLVPNGLGLEGEAVGRPGGAAAARWRRIGRGGYSADASPRSSKSSDNIRLTRCWQWWSRWSIFSDKPHCDWAMIRKFKETLNLWSLTFLLCPSLTSCLCPAQVFLFSSHFQHVLIIRLDSSWPTSILRSDASFPMPSVCAEGSFRSSVIFTFEKSHRSLFFPYFISQWILWWLVIWRLLFLAGQMENPWDKDQVCFVCHVPQSLITKHSLLYLMFWHLGLTDPRKTAHPRISWFRETRNDLAFEYLSISKLPNWSQYPQPPPLLGTHRAHVLTLG